MDEGGEKPCFIYAEAGASCGKAARAAREAGLTGLEFLGGSRVISAGRCG